MSTVSLDTSSANKSKTNPTNGTEATYNKEEVRFLFLVTDS